LFLTEARQNLTAEQEAGLPSRWTKEELDSLEKSLKEHETWLNTWVEKQKSVKSNQDPVIETTEMKARAKVLQTQLEKLWKRKVPKVKKTSTSTSATSTTETAKQTANESSSNESTSEGEIPQDQVPIQPPSGHDEL